MARTPDILVGTAGWSIPRASACRFDAPGTHLQRSTRYDGHFIATLATTVRGIPRAEEVWCVFDNTASGAAIENAWELRETMTNDSTRR